MHKPKRRFKDPTRTDIPRRSGVPWVNRCEACQKRSFISRADARQVAKQSVPHRSVYPCPASPDVWHVGQLAFAVRQGVVDRHQYYGRAS
jgi:hypothetical protein